jgi:hypothetical protein
VAHRTSVTSFIPILVAGLAWQLCGYTQDKAKAPSKVPGEGSDVSCYDESGRLVGPGNMRTFVLESPDGKFRAYAETKAVTHKRRNAHGPDEVECQNTSLLFVAGPASHKFQRVMMVLPTPELGDNSISLADWSPKGHRLLIAEGKAGYGSDVGGIMIRIYNADSGKLSSESFVEEVFRKHAGKDCIGVFQAVGFSEDGGIIVRAGPYFDEGEEQPRADSCVVKKGLWLIAPADEAIRPLPDDYKPKHYGNEVPRELAQ